MVQDTLLKDFQIPVESFALPNGLRVILSRDSSVPVVAIYLIFDVGSRVEVPGKTGFAHLFEHMMFQGSTNAPKGTHFQLIESNGGTMNGSTHWDYTDYYEVMPSNQLALGLWLESDRMRGLAVTQENLDNQRDAVKQERLMSFDNQPYATALLERWPEVAYRNWQNSHSLIGSFEDLDAASVDDVYRFFRTYYAPNNAVLVISGDFEESEARELTAFYFGDIPAQPQPERMPLDEPVPDAPVFHRVVDPLAQVPALILGYPGPPRRSDDYFTLVLLDIVLTAGESCRLFQALVKEKQSVIQFEAALGWPFASSVDYREPGRYSLFLLHNPAVLAEEVRAQVEHEFARLASDGLDDAELQRARTMIRSSRVAQMQSCLSRAMTLGRYMLFDQDPGLINRDMQRLLAVSREEIQDLAGRLFAKERVAVLQVVPAAMDAEMAGAGVTGELA
ncbi:MAG: pitrilysin family protein [Bryobacterales bacterium]|nr:pitrilysin family protein [Bryobacterales bacterium]